MEIQERALEGQIELPRSRDAAVLARRHLDAHRGQVGEATLEDARLIVSELVTNALLHGRGRIRLSACVDDSCLRIEVVDEGTGESPAIRDAADGSPGGWGLRIVDRLAQRWGAFEGSTHVWAEIALD